MSLLLLVLRGCMIWREVRLVLGLPLEVADSFSPCAKRGVPADG